jgi:hypothetical protein
MDAEIRHARYIMSRLLLDCLRLIDEVRVRSGKLTNDEMIIGMAIIVLEHEGGSANISKLSFFTGVPRATVGRIVDRLVGVGLVRWVGRKVAYVHPLDESAIAAARKFWRLLEEAAQQLAHQGKDRAPKSRPSGLAERRSSALYCVLLGSSAGFTYLMANGPSLAI